MCISATAAALLAAGTGAQVVGGMMRQNAYEDQMEQYNRQAAERNRRVSEMYADRREKMYNAQDQQAKLFQQISDMQDAEKAQQDDYAQQKRAELEQTLSNIAPGTDERLAQAGEAADARRDIANRAGDYGVDAGYSTGGGDVPEVVRDAVSRRAESGRERGAGIADANYRIAAFGDLGQSDEQLFRSLNTDLRGISGSARRSAAGYADSAAPFRYRNQALNQAQRFYGSQGYNLPQPTFRQPNTAGADLISGLGGIAAQYGGQNIFRLPAPTGGGGPN